MLLQIQHNILASYNVLAYPDVDESLVIVAFASRNCRNITKAFVPYR